VTFRDNEALLLSQLSEGVFRSFINHSHQADASTYGNDLVGEVSGVVSVRAL
jgi:hypothetical protein